MEERKNTHIQVQEPESCVLLISYCLIAQATRSEGQLPEHLETLWGT